MNMKTVSQKRVYLRSLREIEVRKTEQTSGTHVSANASLSKLSEQKTQSKSDQAC